MFVLFAFLFVLCCSATWSSANTNLFRNARPLICFPCLFRRKRSSAGNFWSPRFSPRGPFFPDAPLLAAYGLTHNVAWHFYLATLVLIALFIVCGGGRFVGGDERRALSRSAYFQIMAVSLALLALACAGFWWQANGHRRNAGNARAGVLDRLLMKRASRSSAAAQLLAFLRRAPMSEGALARPVSSRWCCLSNALSSAPSPSRGRAVCFMTDFRPCKVAAAPSGNGLVPRVAGPPAKPRVARGAVEARFGWLRWLPADAARCSSKTSASSGATRLNGVRHWSCSVCSALTSSTCAISHNN